MCNVCFKHAATVLSKRFVYNNKCIFLNICFLNSCSRKYCEQVLVIRTNTI